MKPDEFLGRLVALSKSFDDILAAALVGSHARGEARSDSDIDIVILGRDPDRLLDDRSWIFRAGQGKELAIEDYGRVQSVRVLMDRFGEVEFGITDAHWADLPLDEGTRTVLRDGCRILYDPEDRLARALAEAASPKGPTALPH